jgi:hypothetical protein
LVEQEKITLPSIELDAFNCPFCKAYAHQNSFSVEIYDTYEGTYEKVPKANLSKCVRCKEFAMWYEQKLIHPEQNQLVRPNDDLPEDIKQIYNEALSVSFKSPRSANALLRLALEKLIRHIIGHNNKSLDDNILLLVTEKGLPKQIRNSMEILRVIGNNSVHPGVIDLQGVESIETATKLFELINTIAYILITHPKNVNELLESLPDKDKIRIQKKYTDNTDTKETTSS